MSLSPSHKGFARILLVAAVASVVLGSPDGGRAQSNAAPVWIAAPGMPLPAGTEFTLNIWVGDSSRPAESLFGLSFELHYSDDRHLEFLPPGEAVAGPFLQPDTYTFTRHEPENRVFHLAVSRKRGASGADGYGVVLILTVRFTDDAPGNWQSCFWIENVNANDSTGARVAVEAGPEFCVAVLEPRLEVIPNPFTPNDDGANDAVEFRRDGGFPPEWSIVIMDRSGRIVRRLSGGANVWDGRDEQGRLMLPGTYLYTIKEKDDFIRRGLLWLIR